MTGNARYVFFDLGGTIMDISCCYLGIAQGWQLLGLEAKVSPAELTRRWIEIGQDLQAKRKSEGPHAVLDISRAAMVAAMEDLEIPGGPPAASKLTEMAWDAIRKHAAPFPDAQPRVFLALRDSGYGLGIITDADEDILHDVLPRVPSLELFAATIGSWQAGAMKPHEQIFRHALDVCKASAKDSVFVGDSPTDVPGASALGLFTVIVDRSGRYPSFPAPDLKVRSLKVLPDALRRLRPRLGGRQNNPGP